MAEPQLFSADESRLAPGVYYDDQAEMKISLPEIARAMGYNAD